MLFNLFSYIILASCLALLPACSGETVLKSLDPLDFTKDGLSLVLAFDFRNDAKPQAALVANRESLRGGGSRSILLPFETRNPKPDIVLASAIGNYNNCTIVSFIPNGSGVGAIGFTPTFSNPPPQPYDLSQLPGSIYFIQSGLQRDFIYRYPNDTLMQNINPPHIRTLAVDQFDALAVAVPAEARGREIKSGQTAIPNHFAENSVTRFYPGKAPSKETQILHIRYELPANKAQKAVADSLLNLITAIFIPLIGLLLMSPGDIKRPGFRRVAIIISCVIQLAVMVWLAVSIFNSFNSLDTPFFVQTGVVVIGGVLSGFCLWVKK